MQEEEHTAKSKKRRVGRVLNDRILPLPLSFSGYREIARCQNFLIRCSGTAEQSAGTISERERERERHTGEGWKRDFIGSLKLHSSHVNGNIEIQMNLIPPSFVPIRVESGATNSRLTSVPCFSLFIFIPVSNSSQIDAR
jgi:hypothetical protein